MLDYLFKRPMLTGGIISSFIALAAFYSKPFIFIMGLLLSLVLGFAILKKNKNLMAFIMVFIMLLSALLTCSKIEKLQKYNKTEEHCRLTVCSINYESADYCLAEVEVLSCETLKKGTKLSVLYKPEKLLIGDIIEADLKVSAITDAKYKKNYYSKGIYLSANATEINKTNEKDIILSLVGEAREYIKETVFSNMAYNEAATLSALIFGDDSFFTDDFNSNVKRSGVSHVMVVSGIHLAILVSFVFYFTDKLFYNRYFKAVIMAAVVIIMIALCGFTMSMIRAGTTYILMALALVLKRQSTPENTLGAAVTAILIISPFAILSLGFQLSVLSTFGILVIALPIAKYIDENEIVKKKSLTAIITAVLTCLSATLLTASILIYNYESVSVFSLLTNLLITNAVTAALCLGVFSVLINLVSPFLAKAVFYIAEYIIKYINFCINKIGEMPFAVVPVPKIAALFAAFFILVIFWFMLTCKLKRNMLKLKLREEKIKREGGRVLKWR